MTVFYVRIQFEFVRGLQVSNLAQCLLRHLTYLVEAAVHDVQGQASQIREAGDDVLIELLHLNFDIIIQNHVNGVNRLRVAWLGREQCHGQVVYLLEAEVLKVSPDFLWILL